MSINVRKICLVLGVWVGLAGCASPGLEYLAPQPAGNPEAANLRRVLVMELVGPHGDEVAGSLSSMLVDAEFDGAPWFDVSLGPRPAIWAGEPDIDDAVAYGERRGVDGVWIGAVETWSDKSWPYRETRKRCVEWDGLFDCERREEYQVDCVDFDAEIEIYLTLVDVRNRAIVAQPKLRDTDSDKICHEVYGGGKGKKGKHRHSGSSEHFYGDYDDDFGGGRLYQMERRMAVSLVKQLRTSIAPHYRYVTATLMETPSTPYTDLTVGFTAALEDAKAGRNAVACGRYEDLWVQYPDDASLAYNMGACAEMFGEYDDANTYYDKAYDASSYLSGKPHHDFMKTLTQSRDRLRGLISSQQRLDRMLETSF